MNYKLTMNNTKIWKDIKSNATLLVNAYYNDPDLFEFVMKMDETKMLVIRVVYLFLIFLIIRSIVRTCMDPFSVKLHKQIAELEAQVSESEDAFQDAWSEKETLEKENAALKEKLTLANKQINSLESRYLCCREAAQNFLNINPVG